ncbi:MAG: tetratricopeptide repeat protein [Pseudomonadota bacterium]
MRSIVRTMLALLVTVNVSTAAVDVESLWQRGDLDASEARMRRALEGADGDDALVIITQIARTYVFRRDFEHARELLLAQEDQVAAAAVEAQIRFWLELGRTYASHQHAPADRSERTQAAAREVYERALGLAKGAALDALTIDALHMFAFVDTAPAAQLRWNERALSVVLASRQASAKAWEASVRNNLGEALFDLQRFDEALAQFEAALLLRRDQGAADTVLRDASWHVARTLRLLGEFERALEIQRSIADAALAAKAPRVYVYTELSLLYEALGDQARAAHFAEHGAKL